MKRNKDKICKTDKQYVKDSRVKARHFSWLQYVIIFLLLGALVTLQASMYGGSKVIKQSGMFVLWFILYWALVSAVVCVVIAFISYRKYDKPMRMLSDAAKRVASGDFSVYVKPLHSEAKYDYKDVMIQDFNAMVAELGSIETMKNDFIANVSHEIKTPLSVIKNYTTALKKDNLTDVKRQEYMDTIIIATDKLSALVTNILNLNKLENQEIDAKPVEFDLCRQLSDCALRFESQWEEKEIKFEFEIEDHAMITADEGMLEVAWNNLLSNAIKFTEKGGTVKLAQASGVDTVTVTVSDNGCGMSDEEMNHIFDKFYQGDTSHAREGNGLGLALAYRVIDIIGGSLSVQSKVNEGTAFTVNLNI